MSTCDLDTLMPHLLTHEGGKVNHPKDPGGKTNQGVTQKVYDAWRANKGLPKQDVYSIAASEVNAIYREQYWNRIMGDRLPAGVNYVVFDGAVNSGCGQSTKWLQRALGVRVDGVIGEATVQAAVSHPNHDALVEAICEQRLKFMRALKTWGTFGKGWARRVAEVKTIGLEFATGAEIASIEPTYFVGGDAKAYIENAKEQPSRAVADATTGGGVATGGLAGTLQQAQDTLAPYASSSDVIQKIIIALVIAGFVVTVAGFIYGRWVRAKQAERNDALDLQHRSEEALLA